MNDEPLTRAELAEVHRYRIGKPVTRALPKDSWRDPVHTVRLLQEVIERERQKRWKKER